MRSRLAVVVGLLVPLVTGCTLLGPGTHYDVTVATEAQGAVLSPGTPASHAEIFFALTDADADRPVPANRTVENEPGRPDGELTIPANMTKAIWRLPLDARGEATVEVPVDRPVVATFRLVESEPPFHVSTSDCPDPQRLRSSLREERLDADGTLPLAFFVACGGEA